MAQGLQVFDENSRLVVDITNRFTRVLGMFDIPVKAANIPSESYPVYLPELVHSGSFTNAAIGSGSGQVFVIPINYSGGTIYPIPGRPFGATVSSNNCVFSPPEFTFSGSNINWSYDLNNTRPIGDPSEWFVGGFNVYYGLC